MKRAARIVAGLTLTGIAALTLPVLILCVLCCIAARVFRKK